MNDLMNEVLDRGQIELLLSLDDGMGAAPAQIAGQFLLPVQGG